MIQPAVSFRDPAGFCFSFDRRILRVVGADCAAELKFFLETPRVRDLVARRNLVSTRRLTETEVASLLQLPELRVLLSAWPAHVVFEHERVPFPSYPYEWPPEMLWEAGRLTLELAKALLADGFGLKDATPYNILYRGCEPVFVDVSSFERRAAGDPIWKPYAQFVRTFLLPLLANRRWGWRLADVFTTRRDGLEPEEVYRLCGPVQRFRPQMLSLVTMPTWLSHRARKQDWKLYEPRRMANREKALFVVESLLHRLQRTLNTLEPPRQKASAWANYMAEHSYSEPAFAAKEQFVDAVWREFQPKRVLDVGANTGHFSERAARAGAEVVAIDRDAACVGVIWRRAREQKLSILPLAVDISRPSPKLGWRNAECPAFLDRAAGAFDGVLMLAVIHHLLVSERIPLEEILRLARDLTTSLLLVEFIAPEDEVFRRLARGRGHLHAALTQSAFERACGAHFDIVRSVALPGLPRRVYCLKRKGGDN